MAYNEKLEDWIDHYFIDKEDLVKNKQMGGVGWLVNGHMCVGIFEQLLVVRLNTETAEPLTKKKGISHFRQHKDAPGTFLSISETVYNHPKVLHTFLSRSYQFTSSLPPNERDNFLE